MGERKHCPAVWTASRNPSAVQAAVQGGRAWRLQRQAARSKWPGAPKMLPVQMPANTNFGSSNGPHPTLGNHIFTMLSYSCSRSRSCFCFCSGAALFPKGASLAPQSSTSSPATTPWRCLQARPPIFMLDPTALGPALPVRGGSACMYWLHECPKHLCHICMCFRHSRSESPQSLAPTRTAP